jgi:glycosyltransferase XagB
MHLGIEWRSSMGMAFIAGHQHGEGKPLHQSEQVLHLEDWRTVPEHWLEQALPRLTPVEIENLLRHKIISYCWMPGHTIHGVVHEGAVLDADAQDLNVVGLIQPHIYRRLVQAFLSRQLVGQAVGDLAASRPWASAKRRLTLLQTVALLLLASGFISMGIGLGISILLAVLMGVASFFFMMIVALRVLCVMRLPKGKGVVAQPLHDDELPVYTVLVPVFREIEVLQQLIEALSKLDYPWAKLDIKIILEAEDRPMHAAIKAMKLPWHFDIIIVPAGKPQTKPRALNYALRFARGSLVTIYDAEDLPDPRQLRLAAAQFAVADRRVACLQAALDFYNPRDNWLTQQFAAEYAGLFHTILPALAAYGLPLPLGGTSNHFRTSALMNVGGWDAFNVTEDADIGIRLARFGYRTGILHSSTLEEANSELPNWLMQRRRWLKGFLQTWLVHNRNPLKLLRQVGLSGFCAIQAMTLGVFASALLHPLLLGVTIWRLVFGHLQLADPIAWAGLLLLVIGYWSAIAANKRGLRKIGQTMQTSQALTLPVYWLLMSAAAWMAAWDFVVAPYHWHKTKHGLTSAQQRRLLQAHSQNDRRT